MSQSNNWNWNEDFKNYFYSDNIRSLINLHHINSYNDFIENKINKILENPVDSDKGNDKPGFYFNRIKGNNPLTVEMKFKKPRLETSSLEIQNDDNPNNSYTVPLTPNLCINRNLDYKAKLIIDAEIYIKYDKTIEKQFELKGVKLCELPLMIYSNQCNLYKMIKKILNYKKNTKQESLEQDEQDFLKLYEIILDKCNFNDKDDNDPFWKDKDSNISIQEHIENLSEKQQYEIVDKIKKYILYHNNENIFEYGGYFIINGKEKVIISQDRLCNNKLYIKYDRIGIDDKTNKTIYEYSCEVKSVDINLQDFKPAKTTYIKMNRHNYPKRYVPNKFSTKNDEVIKQLFETKFGSLKKYINFFINFEKGLNEDEEDKAYIKELFNYYSEKLKIESLFINSKLKQDEKIIEILNKYIDNSESYIKDTVSYSDDSNDKEREEYLINLVTKSTEFKLYILENNKELKEELNNNNLDINLKTEGYAEGASLEERTEKLNERMLEHESKPTIDKIPDTDYNIRIQLKDFKKSIPAYIIFRALGFETDKEIHNFIMGEINIENNEYKYMLFKDILDNCRYEADINGIYTKNQALLYIYECLEEDKQYYNNSTNENKKQNIYKYINNKLFHIFLPHCSNNVEKFNNNKKALFFGYAIQSLLNVYFGYEKITDRDTYKFKRIDSTGKLLSSLFRDWYVNLIQHLRATVGYLNTNASIENFISGIEPIDENNEEDYKEKIAKLEDYFIHKDKRKPYLESIITEGFRKAFRGQWGVKQVTVNVTLDNLFQQVNRDNYSFNKEGIAQELNRMSNIDTISHLRRVQTPMDSSIKITGPRLLNTTQYGYICPLDTPEGALSGLVKNLSIQTKISSFSTQNLENIQKFFDQTKLKDIFISTDEFILTQHGLTKYNNYLKIFINNNWIYSYIGTPSIIDNQGIFICDKIYKFFKLMKRNNIIDYETSISWNIIKKELHFFVDEGRYLRPVYNVDKWSSQLNEDYPSDAINIDDNFLIRKIVGDLHFSKLSNYEKTVNEDDFKKCINLFNILINNTEEEYQKELNNLKNILDEYVALEFIDPEESDNTLISISENELNSKINCEYMDIHPSLIFGGLTSSMSFLNHNPCVRATYSHAQSKQSIAIPTTNFNHRFDTKMLVLNYPQKSMHITKNSSLINYNDLPTGNNAIVAMCTYLGYNQEDGIIINQSSMDRGMYVATHYKTYYVELDDEEELRPPESIKNRRRDNYNKINEAECYVKPGTYVDEKDIIVSKIYSGTVETDTSVAMEKTPFKEIRLDSEDAGASEMQGFEEASGGYVTNVQTGINSDNKRYIKIRVASTSQPDIADKFCSRYANKGVISLTVPSENMPYTKSGITPDIMINPHSIPSRMTVSNLLEIFTGKIAAESGYYINGSPFENNDSTFEPPSDDNKKSILDLLQYYGFENRGNEIMYNGLTGEMFSAKIFIGPAYYQRLKHIVRDKINARNGGEGNPVDQITRQPIKGRKRGGGIRIGEMEKDSLISHGTSQFLKESMLDRSDIYSCVVCKLCGRIAIHNINNNKEINCCKYCDNKQYFTQIMIPHCAKLLIQEFETASVTYRLVTEDLIH